MGQKPLLTATPTHLLKEYRRVLEDHGLTIDRLIVFGSYAKGTPKPWSDLDVCVVSRAFGKNGYDEMVFLKQLTNTVDSMIEPHPYHPKDLNDPFDPLAWEIRRTGKII